MKLKRNLRTAALGFALAALAALSPLGIETATAKTLVYCSPGSPLGFDPASYLYTGSTTHDAVAFPLYNRLTEIDPGTADVIPEITESWSVSDDGMEYTFNLRRGVKFHSTDFFTPTRDFNADDVIFSFTRLWQKDHPWHEYDSSVSWEDSIGDEIGDKLGLLFTDIRRDDDYTVTFVLAIPFTTTLGLLSHYSFSILSAEYAAQLEASNSKPNLNTHPIGTGPFQFVTYQPDTEIRYKGHPNYWNGVSEFDDMIVSITPDEAERLKKGEAGECNPSPLGIETAHAKTRVYCSMESPLGFDPGAYSDALTLSASSPLYDRLVDGKAKDLRLADGKAKDLIPELAESLSVSDDGWEYTFKLRRGVKFHSTDYFTPTRDFNADDVIFSFARQWKEDHPWHDYIPGNSWEKFNGSITGKFLTDIRRDDDYTVTFVQSFPLPVFLLTFPHVFASIVSAEYAAQLEASNSMPNLNTHPIGTGPFQFVNYLPNKEIRYKAHPEYWNGVLAIDELIFSITPDESEHLKKVEAGECDLDLSSP